MNEYKVIAQIKTSIPSKAQEAFKNALELYPELLIVLSSFEIQNPYNISLSIRPTRNPLNVSLLEGLARVCYWLTLSDEKAAKSEFVKLSTEQQQIIYGLFKGHFQRYVGRDFMLDNIPKLYELQDLYASFIKLPSKLESDFEEHLEGIKKDFDLSKAKLPVHMIIIPKSSRKSSKIYYIIKKGNSIHSNLSNNLIREYFKNNFHYASFGCIFLYSKVANRRYGKHIIPICFSLEYRSILELYKGNTEVKLEGIIFDTKKYFPEIKSNYIDVKFPQTKLLGTSEVFEQHLRGAKENNLLVFSNGIVKINFITKYRSVKVADFILDDEFIPIGLLTVEGTKHFINISNDFVEGGLDNRYITVTDRFLGNIKVSTKLFDIQGKGLFQCNHCGAVTKTNIKGLCSSCYSRFHNIAEFCGEGITIPEGSLNPFNIKLCKCDIKGDSELTFIINYENVIGKQLSLPIYEYWVG
jgi:hypothetical protein